MPLALFCFRVRSRSSRLRRPPATVAFDAPKYGLSTRIPKDWRVAVHEEDDRIFVAIIPQEDFERPGIAACELALAPENLDEYRTRIDTNAKKNGRRSGKLASNLSSRMRAANGSRPIWEFHPDAGGFWHEVSVRMIANRQLYTFILNVEDSIYAKARPAFDALVDRRRLHGAKHRRRPARKEIEPLDSARIPIRARLSGRLAAGACAQPGRPALRQRTARGHLVRQSSGARAPASQDPTWKTSPSSFPISSSRKTRTAKSSHAR